NTAAAKREERKFFTALREAEWLKPLRAVVPTSLNRLVGKAVGLKKIEYPAATLPPDYHQYVIEFMRKDAHIFLQRYGKPADFWSFDER
ncbi:MAG: hypothetical protein WBA12_09860, partial [Catalinimonas sp.]